jgi:acyl phosphate:glycerol-3-phosphate acyltransferase
MIELGLKFTLAYLLGSVLGSLVIGWFRGGVDIRKLGSGNAGGTNALRTQGKWFALWVMVIDIGKGVLAASAIPALAIPGVAVDPEIDRSLVVYAVAFAAIVGHVFPVWFGFRGGKGGATAAGLLVYFAPALALPILGAWLLVVLLTGFVGLATISASLAAAALIGLTRLPEQSGLFVFACVTAALLIYAHRGNIRRMLNGTESRFARFGVGRLLGGK